MEETGVIRRLDALGRIVIPREYRKLHRIEVGDPLEMRLTTGGEITIKKVDLSAQLKTLGELALHALATYTQKRMAVCSQEEWLLFSHKSETAGELPPEMVKAVSGQKPCLLPCGEWGLKTQAKNAALFPVITVFLSYLRISSGYFNVFALVGIFPVVIIAVAGTYIANHYLKYTPKKRRNAVILYAVL